MFLSVCPRCGELLESQQMYDGSTYIFCNNCKEFHITIYQESPCCMYDRKYKEQQDEDLDFKGGSL